MKDTRSRLLAALHACCALATAAAFAISTPCAAQAASAPDGDCPAPMHGQMNGRAHGRCGANYTPGWMLMTPQERRCFAQKMRAATSREECLALVEQQRAEIEACARAAGRHMPHRPRRMACTGFPK